MIRYIITLLCLILLAHASDVTLEWDANAPEDQVEYYTVYEKVADTWTPIVVVNSGTFVPMTVTPTAHTYAVTASNLWAESGLSESVSTPGGPPSAPQHLRIPGKVALNIEKSPDLVAWEPAATIYFDDAERMFFRMDLEP